MSLKEKRQIEKLKKFIKSEVKASMLVEIVSGTIQDVASGQHPDDAEVTPFHTAGDLRSNPRLKGDPEFLNHAVAAATGRLLRMIMIQSGLEPQDIMPLVALTDEEEKKAVRQLQARYTN